MEGDSEAARRKGLAVCRLFYFLYYGGLGSIWPFLVVYYDWRGLTGAQIGVLASIPLLIQPLSAPLVGALNDLAGRPARLLRWLLIGLTLGMIGVHLSATYAPLLLLAIVLAVSTAPISPIIDNTVIDLLGEKRQQYGRHRLFASIGWGMMGLAGGWAMDRWGMPNAFNLFYFFMAPLLATTFILRARSAPPAGPFWPEVGVFMRNPQWLHFLVAVFFSGLSITVVTGYLPLHLERLGASKSAIGLSNAIAMTGEIPLFFLSDRLLRFGPQRLFNVGMGMLIVRAMIISLTHDYRIVLASQLLHWCSYSIIWVAGVSYASVVSPKGLGTTAQGIFGGIFTGLGGGIGTLLGGWIYQTWDTYRIYSSAAAIMAGGATIYFILGLTVPGLRLSLPETLRERAARFDGPHPPDPGPSEGGPTLN